MKFFWNNRIDALAETAIVAGSEADGFPVQNVANEQQTKKWRSTTDATSPFTEWITFDLASALQNTAFLILNHDIDAGDANHEIQAHTANSWGAPSFQQAITHAAGVMLETFDETYRWWRWRVDKSSGTETREIGRLFLGTYYQTEVQPDYEGYSRGMEDNSVSMKTAAGQIYSLSRPSPRTFALNFSGISNTERNALLAIVNAVGTFSAFFVQVDDTAPAGDELSELIHVKLRQVPVFTVAGFDAELTWNLTLELMEAL